MSVEVTRLDNGVRVVTENRRSIESAAIGAWIDIGSRYEPLDLWGATHCLEHMLFKGTGRRSARDIAVDIERVGGHMNAYTSREHTTYYARVLKEDIPLAIDLISDILLNSVIDPGELQREQEVIVQEIGQAHDTPDDIIYDYLQEAAFGENGLGRSILGTSNSVRSLTSPALKTFLAEKYHAESLVISAVGNLDHETIVALVDKAFGSLSSGERPVCETATFKTGRVMDVRDLEQVHLALAWSGASFACDDHYTLQVASMLLGGGMSSRLFQEVRENRGLAYSIYSFSSSHADTGLFCVYGGTGMQEAQDMLNVTRGEMMSLAARLTDDELLVGKAQLKAGLLMGVESTTARMEQLGRHMLIHGRPIPTDEIVDRIDGVTADAVQAEIGLMLEVGPALVAIGEEDIEHLSWGT